MNKFLDWLVHCHARAPRSTSFTVCVVLPSIISAILLYVLAQLFQR